MASAQLSKILRQLERHRHALDLDQDRLGDRLIDATVEVMEKDFDAERAPDGRGWDELSEGYYRWKERHALTTATGYLEGDMATSENFAGERKITSAEAAYTFGATPAAQEKARWFQLGDSSRNRPPRPFIGISAEAKDRADKIVEAQLKKRA